MVVYPLFAHQLPTDHRLRVEVTRTGTGPEDQTNHPTVDRTLTRGHVA